MAAKSNNASGGRIRRGIRYDRPPDEGLYKDRNQGVEDDHNQYEGAEKYVLMFSWP